MDPQEFLKKYEADLLQILRDYDAGEIQHDKVSEFAWSVIADCEKSGLPSDAVYTVSEHAYWAAIWMLQHLADQEHWADNITQPDVQKYIRIQSGEESLPRGEEGLRP